MGRLARGMVPPSDAKMWWVAQQVDKESIVDQKLTCAFEYPRNATDRPLAPVLEVASPLKPGAANTSYAPTTAPPPRETLLASVMLVARAARLFAPPPLTPTWPCALRLEARAWSQGGEGSWV